jgi:hypothetical protein
VAKRFQSAVGPAFLDGADQRVEDDDREDRHRVHRLA